MLKKKIIQLAISPGGVKKHIFFICKNITHEKFDVIAIFPHQTISEKWIKKGESEYKWFFDQNNLPYYILEIPRNINPFQDIKYFFKLIKILKKENPDVLHCHSSKPGILGRLAGKICGINLILYTPHSIYYSWQKGLKRHLFLCIEKFLSYFCDYIIAVSNSEKEFLNKTLNFPNKTIAINNGIDLEEIDKFIKKQKKAKKDFNISSNKNNIKVLLTITRLSAQKDTITLLKSINLLVKKFSDFVLLIAGDGEEKNELEKFVKKNNLEKFVKFLGWREDIYDLILNSDIGILSSKKEGLPYSVLEFAAFKKPVVGSDTIGTKDCIIHNKTGYLFPVGDYQKLANYLLLLLKDDAKIKIFGENARKFVEENFSIDQMITKLEEIYEKA